jgi:putative transcriptional regulator
MPKRNLFAELTEGIDALACTRKGKKTLCTTEVNLKPVVEIGAEELRTIREKLYLLRPARLITGSRGGLNQTHKQPS